LIFTPHAIDNRRFTAVNDDELQERKKSLGIEADEIVFLFAGKLSEKKNPDILIKSFLAVANNRNSIKLIIAGSGELEESLKRQYAHETRVIFLGFQNQTAMPLLYKVADVFVLPSKGPGETWGLAINEAMACGRAVLVSNKCGCAADLVQEERNGYVFKSEDSEDLSSKISSMLDKNKLLAMGRASFDIIQNWSYNEIIQAIQGLVGEASHRSL
jgi:glycosyltransferase involved in cell wall biosynthesis